MNFFSNALLLYFFVISDYQLRIYVRNERGLKTRKPKSVHQTPVWVLRESSAKACMFHLIWSDRNKLLLKIPSVKLGIRHRAINQNTNQNSLVFTVDPFLVLAKTHIPVRSLRLLGFSAFLSGSL